MLHIQKNECNYIDIARVIGIYLVILGHAPTYGGIGEYIHPLIYTFHMPLFFAISGVLHKQESLRTESILKLVKALIIPYILYNIIGIIIKLASCPPSHMQDTIHRIIDGDIIPNGSTWFFLSLFGVKFISLFLKDKKSYVIASIICVLLLTLFKIYIKEYNHSFTYTAYRLNATLMAFPFFAFGYLMQDKINYITKPLVKWVIIFLSAIIINAIYNIWGSIDMFFGSYNSFIATFIAGTVSFIAIIYFSQNIFKYLKYEWIKTISRGTMIIVALHIYFQDLFSYVFGEQSFVVHIFVSAIILGIFYFIIKLTYHRIPVLYGKEGRHR